MGKKQGLKNKILILSLIVSISITIVIYFSVLSILKNERKIIYTDYLEKYAFQLKMTLTPYIIENNSTMIRLRGGKLFVKPVDMIKINFLNSGQEIVFVSDKINKNKIDYEKFLSKTIIIKNDGKKIAKISVYISKDIIKGVIVLFTKRYLIFSFLILILLNLTVYYLASRYLKGLENFIREFESLKEPSKSKKLQTDVSDLIPIVDLINQLLLSIERNTEELFSHEKLLQRAIKTRKEQLNNQLKKLIDLENRISIAKKDVEIGDKMSLLTNIYMDMNEKLETPIMDIISEITEFLKNKKVDDNARQKLEIARDSAHKILNMIYKIKNYTSLSKVSKTTIVLERLIKEIILKYKKETNINFVFKKGEKRVKILGNKIQLIETFNHIIRNSIEAFQDFEGKENTVKISVKLEDPFVNIIIEDNGPGFQDIASAFNLFYTTKVNPQNKGYGLALVEKIVSEHGGKVILENLNEGGARVIVSLPVIEIKGIKEENDDYDENIY